jgi:hypothetical protein
MTGRLEARTAIEALRAGVPNRTAVRLLGSAEDAIEHAFDAGLDRIAAPGPGQVFAGGFGTGKSHLLGYLREVALRRNFVVSWVTVSKETPLASPRHVFAAAMRSALVPGRNDDAVTVALAEIQRRQGAVQELELWASTPDAGLSPAFAAMLHILSRQLEPEILRRLEAFLAGGRLPGPALRQALGQAGARGLFDLHGATEAVLLLQRLRFIPRLFQAAGFAGWCVLVDEAELIGRYGPLQRAQAYAELARWLGLEAGLRVPGLHVVAAITDDFADEVINARQDSEKLPERLRLKGLPQQAELALLAMRAIERAPLLHEPAEEALRRDAETLRGIYAEAHGWEAPALPPGERRKNRTMRHHVRGWIAQWDMLRLEGQAGTVEVIEQPTEYGEDEGLGMAPPDAEAEP